MYWTVLFTSLQPIDFHNQNSETSVLEREALSGFHLLELSEGQEQRLGYFYLEINQKIYFALWCGFSVLCAPHTHFYLLTILKLPFMHCSCLKKCEVVDFHIYIIIYWKRNRVGHNVFKRCDILKKSKGIISDSNILANLKPQSVIFLLQETYFPCCVFAFAVPQSYSRIWKGYDSSPHSFLSTFPTQCV